MHLASSSKVERLVDVSAKLLKEGYDAGYRQGRVKGFSVGVGAGFLLAIALWMGMAMVAANAEVIEATVRIETYDSVAEVANRCNSLAVETVGMQAHGAPGCAVGGAMGGQIADRQGVKVMLDDCLIITRKPTGADDFAALHMLGHEGWHCFVGKYHE